MKKLICVVLALICFGCEPRLVDLQPNQLYRIPFSSKIAVGTDSTIVIIDRNDGKINTVIDRNARCFEWAVGLFLL